MINPFPKKITKQKYTNIRNRIKNHLKTGIFFFTIKKIYNTKITYIGRQIIIIEAHTHTHTHTSI